MRLVVLHSRRTANQALQFAAQSDLRYNKQAQTASPYCNFSIGSRISWLAGASACNATEIRIRRRFTRPALSTRAAKASRLLMAPVNTESRVRSCVVSALKSHLSLSSDKQWVIDFIAESIVVELMTFTETSTASTDDTNKQPSAQSKRITKTRQAPAGDGKQATITPATYFVASSLPQSIEEAQETWGNLVYENVDDVENQDVKDFCEELLGALQDLAAQIEEEQGSGSAGSEDEEEGACEMCGRVMPLTKHHLIPRDVHKEWKKKGASFDDLQAGAMICRTCHNAVHRVADNKTLAQHYNTVEKLMQVPSIQKHVVWAAKQKVVAKAQNLPAKFRHRH